MITILDIETDFYRGEDKRDDNSPYHPDNKLVSVGWYNMEGAIHYCFADDPEFRERVGMLLTYNTSLLVGHNIKFDLGWLRECGFVYDGKLWDTMICEYVLAGGLPVELSLNACCKRYGIGTKIDKVQEYWNDGIKTSDIPRNILEEYGLNDVDITTKLFKKQQEVLSGKA